MSASVVILFMLLASVLGVLIVGIISMAVGGEFSRKHGNRLMRLRVLLQAAALALLVMLLLIGRD